VESDKLTPAEIAEYYALHLSRNLRPDRKGQVLVRCPLHDDHNPSLSVSLGTGLWHCHAGCGGGDIFHFEMKRSKSTFPESKRRVFEAVGRRVENQGAMQAIATYSYQSENGEELFQVRRYQDPGGRKTFRQFRPDGSGGYIPNVRNVRRVLYRLPEVLDASQVLVVEGEKDCDTARSLAFIATTNPGGAGKWRAQYSHTLRDKQVVVIAHADELGKRHARYVARSLVETGATVKLVEALPGAKDMTEWVERGGAREKLLELVSALPELSRADIAAWRTETKGQPADLADRRRRRTRYPFPDELWFRVPLKLVDDGWARQLENAEFKRYITFLRLSNFRYGALRIRVDLKELEKRDGVSPRRAWYIHRRLEERGFIRVEKTRPFTYVLVEPAGMRLLTTSQSDIDLLFAFNSPDLYSDRENPLRERSGSPASHRFSAT
jgi:5S rRNA maturation endonuclease (ribonuclease M5)